MCHDHFYSHIKNIIYLFLIDRQKKTFEDIVYDAEFLEEIRFIEL